MSLLTSVLALGSSIAFAQGPRSQDAAGPVAARPDAAGQTSVGTTLSDMPEPVSPSDRLTLKQALDAASHESPQEAVARYSVLSAHENLNSQRAPINPTIAYSGLNNTVAPIAFGNSYNYVAYVTLETNGAQHWRYAEARDQFHQAQADADTTRLALKQNVIGAYVGLQVADKSLDLERQAYDTALQLSNLTAKRFELGASPQADSIRTRIALVQEEQNLLTAANAVRVARATLNVAIGRPGETPIDAAEPLEYRPIPLQDAAALDRRAAAGRPEIRSADAYAQSLKSATQMAHSAYYPDVILGRDFGPGSQVQLGFVFPIDLGSIHGAVRKAEADAKTQAAQAQLTRQNVGLDVRSAYLNISNAQKQVESYQSGILPESESLLSRVKQGYALGASTILDLIDAQNTSRTTLNSYYAAVGSYEQAVYQLQHAIGAPVDLLPAAAAAPTVSSPAPGSVPSQSTLPAAGQPATGAQKP